jgi:hypothetical protein
MSPSGTGGEESLIDTCTSADPSEALKNHMRNGRGEADGVGESDGGAGVGVELVVRLEVCVDDCVDEAVWEGDAVFVRERATRRITRLFVSL